MPTTTPTLTTHLHELQQAALEARREDVAFVRAWQPCGGDARQHDDLMFVAAQVLTVGEVDASRARATGPLAWRPAGSSSSDCC
jgi:hypothetical protein